MKATLKVIREPQNEIEEHSIELSRLPVLGEYVFDGDSWFEVKRVVHRTSADIVDGDVYAIPVVDPTHESLTLAEWLEPAP